LFSLGVYALKVYYFLFYLFYRFFAGYPGEDRAQIPALMFMGLVTIFSSFPSLRWHSQIELAKNLLVS
jgi:hypothetical protein